MRVADVINLVDEGDLTDARLRITCECGIDSTLAATGDNGTYRCPCGQLLLKVVHEHDAPDRTGFGINEWRILTPYPVMITDEVGDNPQVSFEPVIESFDVLHGEWAALLGLVREAAADEEGMDETATDEEEE